MIRSPRTGRRHRDLRPPRPPARGRRPALRRPGQDRHRRRALDRVVDALDQALIEDEAQPYLRLFGQLHALAHAPDSPYAKFARESVLDWLPIIEQGFAADGLDPNTARELTTLTLAVIRGLLQDANAVGDHRRVRAAFDRYASLLQPACAPHRC